MISFKAFIVQLKETPVVMDKWDSAEFRQRARDDITTLNLAKLPLNFAKFSWKGFRYFTDISNMDVGDLEGLGERNLFVKIENEKIQYAANINLYPKVGAIYQSLVARGRRSSVNWGDILDGLIRLSKLLEQSGKVISSDTVTIGGKKMWENLSKIALNKGYKVSVYNERTKSFTSYDRSQGDIEKWLASKGTWVSNYNRILITP